jgi:hypothetical protein
VPPPAAALNATQVGAFNVGQGTFSIGQSSADLPRGQQRELAVAGTGISQANGTTLTISGAGTTIGSASYQGSGSASIIIVRVTVDSGAAPGPRNVILRNSNSDISVITGGVFIR